MAFRTNKVPAIEERTVSGSSVSFHSNFALPLKACKVSFSATQAGSGDPSPSNPRAISGVSAIGLNANSTPVSVSLGETRYGGVLDVLTGILTVDTAIFRYSNQNIGVSQSYIKSDACAGYFVNNSIYPRQGTAQQKTQYSDKLNFARANIWTLIGYVNRWTINNNTIFVNIDNSLLEITDYTQETVNSVTQKIRTYLSVEKPYFTIPIEPITVQLSANELSSIIGNNTFSTDTGTLEITFSDLQEKTASGSVASFNCALNKPLVACTTEFMCTQEGSGEPSPSNPRAIVGVDDITITANGITVFIDLDGTRYGGYVDVVRKKLVLTNNHDALSNYTWGYTPSDNSYFSASFAPSVLDEYAIKRSSINDYPFVTTDIYKYNGFGYVASLQNNNIITNGYGVYIRDDRYTSVTDFINNMNSHYIVYELSTPIEISLSDIPTLSTIIGNNSFASDTGDTSLVYNDLDIAKRGSFREVFKLP